MEWEVIIGLEIHAQLSTKSKIFSGASTAYGALPNTQACEVDLGLPGVLPVINESAVIMAIKFGLATQSTIANRSIFARKNYFYPDSPKGYQISQFESPIVHSGQLTIELDDATSKTIDITRAHLEEDAGKSLHEDFDDATGIDLNRAGTPLLEIVSEPQLRSAKEAVAYMKKIHALVRYLDICDGNMQEGSFRCDANVSLRPKGQTKLGIRTETKNLNSFRFVERAINYEIERQRHVLETGGHIKQETRLYDSDQHETRTMRSKEEANDYRYFPDPDLLPIIIAPDFISAIAASLPELPTAKKQRFQNEYQLNAYDASVLTTDKALADYFEKTVKRAEGEPKICANWIIGEVLGALNKTHQEITESPVNATQLGGMIKRINDKTISGKIAKTVFEALWNGAPDVDTVIKQQGLTQVTDTGVIDEIIDEIIKANPTQAEQYRSGKEKLFGFFVGQVMKQTQGKANPATVNQLLKTKLDTAE